MLLITSSLATVSTRRPGRLASMAISRSAEPLLPTLLVTLALTVSSPLPSAVRTDSGTSTDQVRSFCTVAVQVLPPIVTVTVLPASAFTTLPLMVWPEATSAALMTSSPAMVLMITPGSTDSTFTVCDVLVLLPTLSVADAVTVYNASPNAPT